MRLALALGQSYEVVGIIFDFIWRDGRDPEGDWDALSGAVGLDPADARRRIADAAVKAALRRNTEQAIATGVFGVPTLQAGDELFWGDDATMMAHAWLADEASFEDAQMRRVSQLPAAVQRPRG